MKLYARTATGTGLGIDILLTGQMREDGGFICSVEVVLPIGCILIVGYHVDSFLPKTPSGRQLLWADPIDISADNGASLNQFQLRAELVRVNEQRRTEMLRGPLGENWP